MSLFTRRSPPAPLPEQPKDAAPGESQSAAPAERTARIPGERTIPSVNRVRSVQARVSGALAFALMGALGVGLLAWYYSGTATRHARAQTAAQDTARSRASGETTLPPLGRIEPPRVAAAAQEAATPDSTIAAALLGEPPPLPEAFDSAATHTGIAASPYESTPYEPHGSSVMTRAEAALARRLAGPPFARASQQDTAGTATTTGLGRDTNDANDSAPSSDLSAGAGSFAGGDGLASEASAGSASELGALLRPSTTPAVRARLLPTRRLLLPKGAFLDCTLETAIDSSLPGMTTCITATDTFGADGRVVLLERGTKLVGETRGEVSRGSARLFVLWTEARTPTGVVVPLASPGTDELGRSGVTGEVNRHFWERFGAAILISVIDGAVQAAVEASRESDGGTVIVSPSGSRDIMTEVLKDTLALPPTIAKPQGDRIQVLVARDLDFRSVYELRTADARAR